MPSFNLLNLERCVAALNGRRPLNRDAVALNDAKQLLNRCEAAL